jgi:hypothetical protein
MAMPVFSKRNVLSWLSRTSRHPRKPSFWNFGNCTHANGKSPCPHRFAMTPRQTALLEYHRNIAAFGTSPKAPVFIILDLEDSVGFAVASNYQPNCAEKRDAIMDTGAYPAFTLALSIKDANTLLAHDWPHDRIILFAGIETRSPSSLPEEGQAFASFALSMALVADGKR